MKKETKLWIDYAVENLNSAIILLESKLYNPCLQNIQQSVEKTLKAILIEKNIKLKRTHSISELSLLLLKNDINLKLNEEDCEFLDSIYLPSKYPVGNILAYYKPDHQICEKGLNIAKTIIKKVNSLF